VKGSIRVRVNRDGSKRYTCQVFAGRDPRTGKKRYLTGTATSERQAHRLIHHLLNEVQAGHGSRDRATLNDLIRAWLETGGPSGENTRAVYAGYIKNHIENSIGTLVAGKLRVEDIDRWHTHLKEEGLSPASIRKAHNIVRGALTHGVRWGWIATNVAAQSSPAPAPRPSVATPATDAVVRLMRKAGELDPDFATYVRLAAVTGARPGEMCGLRWADLDRQTAEIDIKRRVIRSAPVLQVKALTKTGKTRRIPLDKGTVELLREHQDRQVERAGLAGAVLARSAYIFSDAIDGSTFWRPDSTSRRFRALCARSGLTGIPLYGLRHQAATTLIDQGVDPRTVSERLGNSVTTVLGTYTRARSSADRSAADMMGSLLDS
jgi:integrase